MPYWPRNTPMVHMLTQVDAELQSGSAELQGDVVPLLSLSVEQDPVPGPGPELQRDDVLHQLDLFTPEAV